jgi:PPK2 family polyphosphate:nucleotide phosphotransferase
VNEYQVKPGQNVKLSDRDPDDTGRFHGKKQQARAETDEFRQKLQDLQEVLYAEHKRKVLVLLQGMDTSGKDGAIRHVFAGVNPQGVRVANFKEPTQEELDHDFLWRVHKQVPGRGELVIFNRSHYEEVLVVRVHELVPQETWEGRYDQINAFESLLAGTGTTLLKFYLHIDSDEQKKRLQARLDDPDKHWKFQRGDLQERKLWPAYLQAYEDVVNRTSTPAAPWYIVPANHQWYRDWVIAKILVETLDGLEMKYPEPTDFLEGILIE